MSYPATIDREDGAFYLLGLLLALTAVCALSLLVMKTLFNQSTEMLTKDETTANLIKAEGIDTSSQRALYDNAREKAEEIQRTQQERIDQTLQLMHQQAR